MPSSISLEKEVFLALHDDLIAQFKKECKEKGQSFPRNQYQEYGLGKHWDEKKPSLIQSINSNPAVKGYLEELNKGKEEGETGFVELKGQYLYRKFWKVKKEKLSRVKLSNTYLTVYLLYLAFDSIEAYRRRRFPEARSLEFRGYYYSYYYRRVETFDMAIASGFSRFQASLSGIHFDMLDEIFQGSGQLDGASLFLDFKGPEGRGRKINMIVYPADRELINRPMFFCSFMTITSVNQQPVAANGMIFRKKPDGEVPSGWDMQIRRYLMLLQHTFWVSSPAEHTPANLQVRNMGVDRMRYIVGHYRMGWLDTSGDLILSRLVIEPDYRARIHSRYLRGIEEQFCQVQMSQVTNLRICFTFRTPDSDEVTAFAILSGAEQDNFIEGVICSVGRADHQPEMKKVILLRARDKGEQWEPANIPVKDKVEKTSLDAELTILWQKLSQDAETKS